MATDILLAALAPTVLPGLQRSLEVAFLAGFATSCKLPQQRRTTASTGSGLPALPARQRLSPRMPVKVCKQTPCC